VCTRFTKADERHAFLRQAPVEEERFLERLGLRAGHQHDAGALCPQQRVHLGRARPEAIVHALEGEEELGQLLQELQAHEAVGELHERRPGAVATFSVRRPATK
jgi:hypothetical protein